MMKLNNSKENGNIKGLAKVFDLEDYYQTLLFIFVACDELRY